MSSLPRQTTVFLDTIIARLVPWFLAAAGGNLDLARQTAMALIMSFDAQTEQELRLAAEIVSFGFGALEALSKSVDPDLPLNTVLRLRGSANALQRSKNQCQRALDRLRKERRSPQAAVVDRCTTPGDHLASAQPSPAVETSAPTKRPAHPAAAAASPSVAAAPPRPEQVNILSRQQRRAAQRVIDKAQRRQAELARREAVRAARFVPAASSRLAV